MVRINKNYDLLPATYLFQEIARRTEAFKAAQSTDLSMLTVGEFEESALFDPQFLPKLGVLKLGVGNTTEPLTPAIADGLERGVQNLRNAETYTGYGDEQGKKALREAIAAYYEKRNVAIDPLEVFVSDGAKCDTANIPSIFGLGSVVAVQDPVYPAYVDTNVIGGRGGRNRRGRHEKIWYMPCNPENNFVPPLPDPDTFLKDPQMLLQTGVVYIPKKKADLIYLCSPNNPTGAGMTKDDLKKFVDFANAHKSVIIFDAAYESFIQTTGMPHSIYEIEGATSCAIEINSFSKSAGFAGVRLGWTIVPQDLVAEDTKPGKVNGLWNRRQTTFFNGACNIAQEGGLAALTEDGQKEIQQLVQFYMGNARIIREGLQSMGFVAYGGVDAPYVWMKTPHGMKSWDFFDKLLNTTGIVGTPGAGFGPGGEGYFRFSGFQHREIVEQAMESMRTKLKL